MEVVSNQDLQLAMRYLLQTVAQEPHTEQTIRIILRTTQSLLDCDAIGFSFFSEPSLRIVYGSGSDRLSEDLLRQLASELSNSLHLNPPLPPKTTPHFHSLIATPIYVDEELVAIFWLGAHRRLRALCQLSDDLLTVKRYLLLVANNLHREARHRRLELSQTDFIGLLAHDLRSPLTAMHGFANLLENESLSEQQLHYLSKIQAGIQQITELTEGIQDAVRYDPNDEGFRFTRRPIDLRLLAEKCVQHFHQVARDAGLNLRLQARQQLPLVNANSRMISRALNNLLENAIKYTPRGGNIAVHLRSESDQLIIAVQDDGYGIRREHQRDLFERYVRVSREEHRRIRGNGLGLYIVRSICEHHGGSASVRSSEGVGSTFSINLPLIGENLVPQTA